MLLLFLIGNDLQTELIIFTIIFSCTVCVIFFTSYFSSLLIQRREDEIKRIRDKKESLLVRLLFEDNSDEFNDEILAGYNEFKPIGKGNRLGTKKRKLLRQIMIDEMLKMKKNLSGAGVEDLYTLYDKLGLHEDSYNKLASKKYQLMILGIRELSEMNCKTYYRSIYRCTNHAHEDVRIEAQLAVVRLFGVKGLKFLSRVTYTISEWQQMTLLHLLNNMKNEKPKGIETWFKSENISVIIFSLRLAEKYNCFEFLKEIQEFLHHSNDTVKIQSVFCMKNIYDENSELLLTAYYRIVTNPVKMIMLDVLKSLASEQSIPFLYQQLADDDAEIRLGVLRVLSGLCDSGDIIIAIENELEIKDSVILMLEQIESEL
jgi:hypothetical protein